MSDDPPSPFRPGLLDGRSALVTGGGSGIGFEIARQLGLAGARVAVSGRRAPVLAAAVAALQKEGIDARGVQGDVRDFAACERMVAGAADPQTGALHILVNCAAGNFLAPADALSAGGFKTVMEIDAGGTFNASRAAHAALRRAGGSGSSSSTSPSSPSTRVGAAVVNVSATLHYGATWWQAHASAAKAAVDSLTRTLALEWGSSNIRVNGVAPGPVAGTAGLAKLAPGGPEKLAAMLSERVPLGRPARAADIALAVVFLAAPAASGYVNGHTMVVDGGEWMWRPPLVGRAGVEAASRGAEAASRGVGLAGGPARAKL